MELLQQVDRAVFHGINSTWSNAVFDVAMPFLSGNRFFLPTVALLAIWLLWKGGTRGRCFVAMMAVVIICGELMVTAPLKRAFNRERPYAQLPDATVRAGKSSNKSMPSGHAALWAAATTLTLLYYRRAGKVMVPIALGVGYSRIYVGVHWPSDVLAGFAVGAGYALGISRGLEFLWNGPFRRFFPRWWARRPSLLHPERPPTVIPPGEETAAAVDRHWIRLGFLLIFVLLTARIFYLRAAIIDLSEDEAYQWLWSKHPDLSYYSKPPFIAYAQWIGTHIAGDTELGVRLLSPVVASILGLLVLRFVAAHAGARAAFWSVLALQAAPLLAVGSILMTIDPLTVLFWTLAMFSGWRAITTDSTRAWLWTGVWLGGSFLSKYFSPFQWACFAIFFLLTPAARVQLRRPGPWLALGINLLSTIPVAMWNARHNWITVMHLSERGGLNRKWEPTLRFFWDFLYTTPLLLNPIFFIGMAVAVVGILRRQRNPTPDGAPSADGADPGNPWTTRLLLRYLLCMSLPVFLFYFAYTFRARVQPNWICTAIVPVMLASAIHGAARLREGARWPRHFLTAGLSIGLPLVILLHDTNLIGKIAGAPLPAGIDPLRRVRARREMTRIVDEQRIAFAQGGKPVFVIANHYGIAGLLSFYSADARAGIPGKPLVYARSSDVPENQLWFWPEYRYGDRTGDDALYVQQADEPVESLDRLKSEFESVTDLGVFDVKYRERIFHRIQIYGCRNLRAAAAPGR